MTLSPIQQSRICFLLRVIQKECKYLLQTDTRLFGSGFSMADAKNLDSTLDQAERVEAFVGRFGRLQDTLGDKLLPVLLLAVGERTGPAIDNLDRAERFGWLAVEPWLGMRSLRNQMVHEYVEDIKILHNALTSGHAFVPQFVATAQNMMDEVVRRGLCNKNNLA
jgi:uncharacterized protein with HEPN domain